MQIIKLATDEIHVWYAWLDEGLSGFAFLSPDERDRAERFLYIKEKNRFIKRRGILRRILGHYLNAEPAQIQYHYYKNDKPSLTGDFGEGKLYFNLSHSGGLAVYAFTHLGEIGIDVERIHDFTDMLQTAESFFSSEEATALGGLPERQQKQGFFNCWTRKEAFIKATGDGLSCPLDEFEVSLVPGEPAGLLSIKNDSRLAAGWSICDVNLPAGYAGAVAIEGKVGNIRYQEWTN
jgi:4'-phosphopantetheinyl transferase